MNFKGRVDPGHQGVSLTPCSLICMKVIEQTSRCCYSCILTGARACLFSKLQEHVTSLTMRLIVNAEPWEHMRRMTLAGLCDLHTYYWEGCQGHTTTDSPSRVLHSMRVIDSSESPLSATPTAVLVKISMTTEVFTPLFFQTSLGV